VLADPPRAGVYPFRAGNTLAHVPFIRGIGEHPRNTQLAFGIVSDWVVLRGRGRGTLATQGEAPNPPQIIFLKFPGPLPAHIASPPLQPRDQWHPHARTHADSPDNLVLQGMRGQTVTFLSCSL